MTGLLKSASLWWVLGGILFLVFLLMGQEHPWPQPPDWSQQPARAQVTMAGSAPPKSLGPAAESTFADPALSTQLKAFKAGDMVQSTKGPDGKARVQIWTGKVEPGQRLLALYLSFFVVTFLVALVTRGKLRALVVGADNRYSKSKVQLVVWFVVVLSVYLSTLFLRWRCSGGLLLGGIQIPDHLLQLAGLSGLSFAAAKGITQSKQNAVEDQKAVVHAAAAAGARVGQQQGRSFAMLPDASGGPPKILQEPDPTQVKTRAQTPSWRDLVTDDNGNPDLGDLQMVLLTLLAVGIYLTSAYLFLGALEMRSALALPELDQSLLGLLGVSHLTYLTKKAASDPNAPVLPTK